MNKKNLIDAFGEINEEMFAKAERESFDELSAESAEEAQAPVFVEGGKHKPNIRAALYAGAGVAACVALAVLLPILTNNTKLPYGNGSTQYSEATSKMPSQTEPNEQSQPTESTYTGSNTSTAESTEITEPEKTTEEPPYIPNDPFEVREYPDDNIVPAEWMPVYSFAEAAKHFDEIVSADVSKMDTADAIIALANKNVIFMNYFWIDCFWTADHDHPYYSENYKNPYASDYPVFASPLLPILLSSEYYTDIQEIYDLGSETYTENALNNFYTPMEGVSRKCFFKENGVSYVDVFHLPIWDFAPFKCRTYIEIVSETENKCSFIWYIPEWWERLNEPEEGYEFVYYKRKGEAVYENGSWKLSDIGHDAYMPDWLE